MVEADDQPIIWVRWSYTPDEWRRFDESEWTSAQLQTVGVLGIAAFWFFLILLLSRTAAAPVSNSGFTMLLVTAPFLCYAAFAYHRSYQLHTARQRGKPEIGIGPAAIVQPGGWLALNGITYQIVGPAALNPPMHTLRKVQVHPQDPTLLQFRGQGWRNWPTVVSIPIPLGHETEAALLIERFQREILSR